MRLRTTDTSPFGRKVRMALLRLGLEGEVAVEGADPLDPADSLRNDNPLGKMPVMFTDDGRRLLDSRVILEYLDARAGGGVLIPAAWPARGQVLTRQAIADGAGDAAVLVVYESRHRPPELRHEPWVDFQRDKIRRALELLAGELPDPKTLRVDSIALACLLSYLDWRQQVEWRGRYPALVAWLDAFSAANPEFEATAAQA
jgi:glutathione S-transferase